MYELEMRQLREQVGRTDRTMILYDIMVIFILKIVAILDAILDFIKRFILIQSARQSDKLQTLSNILIYGFDPVQCTEGPDCPLTKGWGIG